LRDQTADMGAEPGIDARQIVERVVSARQPAQQQKAAAEAQLVAEAGEIGAERRQRKGFRRDLGKINLAERMQVTQRRLDLADLARREDANPLLPKVDARPLPDRRALDHRGAHSVSPPSTMTVWPVTIAAPAHRKKITSAMSSGL